MADAWETQGEMPSGAWFNYRRLVGGTRVLLREASPWRLVVFRDRVRDQVDQLVDDVSTWSRVETGPHRFGGREFRVAGREVGHVHDWGLLDVPLVRPLRDAVVASREAARHHILADSGWVTTVVETESDVEQGVRLLRLSYLWHLAEHDLDRVDRAETDVLAELRTLDLDDQVLAAFEHAIGGDGRDSRGPTGTSSSRTR